MNTPSKPLLNDSAPLQLVGPDGTLIHAQALTLTDEDARLLRTYKKFLLHYGYREALYCTRCFEGNRSDGLDAYVTDHKILFRCRCRSLFYEGQTL